MTIANIMIVEDEIIVANDIKARLQKMNYAITSMVNTGEKAVEKADQEHPDLILMDIKLKGQMDGIEAAELIRGRLNIPLVFLTAYADEKNLKRAQTTIPNGFILKPFRDKDLQIAIKMALYVAKIDTQRKKAERALENAKNQWEATFDAITDWIFIIDKNFNIIRSNKASGKLFGLLPQNIVGKRCFEIFHGTKKPISDCPIKKAVKNRTREEFEFQAEKGRWWHVLVEPVESIKSKDSLTVHVVKDITDRKTSEQKVLVARKAEAFRILAGGLAHDYNNLLTTIWGNISLLQDEIKDPIQQELLEETETACKVARSLTHKFLSLSKRKILNKSQCDIEQVLSLAVQNSLKPDNVKISYEYPTVSPRLEIDLEQMLIVFQNIIVNATEAMPEGGNLNIKAEIVSTEQDDQQNANLLEIYFEDTGTGIAEGDLIKLFDPYFTSKAMGAQKGVGLGLPIAQAIINRHGGNIFIDSDMGKGTTVIVSLPIKVSSQ